MRENSYTSVAVRTALEGAAQAGAEVELLDLRDFPLPLVDVVYQDKDAPADALRFRDAVRGADAVIIGTPEYHGGMSGALKNALDWLRGEEIDNKVTGLVGVSGGALGAHDAITQVRTTLRALHAITVPEQAGVAQAYKAIRDGQVVDENLKARLIRVGAQVARFASAYSRAA